MQMAINPDEGFLNQILGALAITNRTMHEVEQSRAVAVNQFVESQFFAREETRDQRAVVRLPKSDRLTGFPGFLLRRELHDWLLCCAHLRGGLTAVREM